MDLELTADDRAFRDEVRAFLNDTLPADLADKVKRGLPVPKAETRRWIARLNRQGWAAPNWPEAHGGTDWGLVRRHIFDMECRRAHCPPSMGFNFNMLGPAIIQFGTEAQKAYYLPRILDMEDWWCQGYSEPEAGSDLASLRTRAERDGDDYVVNGTKIWTSGAEEANRIFCLVRTDPDAKPQRGISFLMIDMASPGIEVRPLLALNGARLWNQVFFENVRVPRANLLGEENRGWTVAKSLLGDERIMVSRVSENSRLLGILKEIAALEQSDGQALAEDAGFQAKIADLEIRLQALEIMSLRMLADAAAGKAVGAEPSALKALGSRLVQAMDTAIADTVGYYAVPDNLSALRAGRNEAVVGPKHAVARMSNLLHHRGYTIAGGTTEVQYNVIAKQVLGL